MPAMSKSVTANWQGRVTRLRFADMFHPPQDMMGSARVELKSSGMDISSA
jgi:hypothetical protein